LRDYIQKNNLDAVMLVVVSGLTKRDKITAITQMKSLTSDYNHLIMTAQILDGNGTILWEYPNFRQTILSFEPMLNLEYPDFSEAEANLSTSANVKFRTIEGIRRIFEQKRKDLLLRETQETEVFGRQFDEMINFLKFDPDKEGSGVQSPAESPRPTARPAQQPVRASEPKPTVAPPAPRPAAPPVETQVLPPAEEITPAKSSTL
jgi:hypothetical protein